MPEKDQPLAPKKDVDIDALLRMVQQADDARRADSLRADTFRQPMLFNNQKNCMRCHEIPGQNRSFDLMSLNSDRTMLAFMRGSETARQKSPEERLRELPPVGQVALLFNRMPDKANFSIKDGKISFSTDFAKMVEVAPTVRLDPNAREVLNRVKSIDLEGDKFTARLDKPASFKVDVDLKLVKVKEIQFGTDKNPNVSFDVKFDPKDPGGIAIEKIEGLTVKTDVGLSVAVRGLALKTKDGKPVVEMTIDNPLRVPPTITVQHPLEKVVPGIESGTMTNIIRALADAKTSLQKKDLSAYIDHITEPGLRDTVKKLAEGVTSITKDGDKVTITRNNGTAEYSMGGPSIKVSPYLSFRIGNDPDAPRIFDVEGVMFAVPLPSELKIGDKYFTGIKEISLGHASSDGSRTLTVRTDSDVKSASLRLNKDMQPATDGNGTFYIDSRVKNLLSDNRHDALDVRLRITNGQLNMSGGEVADIVSRATWQAADFSPSGAGLVIISGAAKVYSWLFD